MYNLDPIILQRYAKVLVNFALGSGNGIKPGEVVRLISGESAKPLYVAVRNQILKSGGFVISAYSPDGVSRDLYELANDWQLDFFPEAYMKGIAEQIDHSISIISEVDKHELEGIDPNKIMRKAKSMKPYREWLDEKENKGKFTWTLALYGTEAMAAEAGMSEKDYWEQIIKACFLDEEDPIAKWKEVSQETERLRTKLNVLKIQKVHIVGEGVDLSVKLGSDRKWLGGSGRNIPSFEVFISPDWRGTEGTIEFNQPLYRYGTMISGVKLRFESGRVVESNAETNYDVLREMLANENADKIGEFSLTDKRLSRIDKFMAETLFDENISGPFGNTHIALGRAYQDSYVGDAAKVSKEEWERMGFNDSVVHTDIVSTTKRTVTATLEDGTEKVIYKDGEFTI